MVSNFLFFVFFFCSRWRVGKGKGTYLELNKLDFLIIVILALRVTLIF